ncbi:MAG: protein phosphatase 2C domain-containing protein, partial [Chitinophagaceae bacterium]
WSSETEKDFTNLNFGNYVFKVRAKINKSIYNNLGKAVFKAHKKLEEFAASNALALKDLNTTLIFTLIKKYPDGYTFLSFGVGDCPIAIVDKDKTEVVLMNWLDVGDFGGGTRFITMPEIFKSDKFASRFGFRVMKDFSYLVLMSDGIYDPKFVVENALADINKWQQFLEDLGGKNEDKVAVVLQKNNPEIVNEFSRWMDFWSPGNHDDRTLAIVF